MKSSLKLVLAALAGVSVGIAGGVIGGSVVRGQQAKPGPGFVIAEVDVHDPAAMQKYGEKVPETLAPFKHQFLVRGSKAQPLEGDPPKGAIVVIQFESAQKAREWYDSPAYRTILPIRQGAATSRLYIVEGLPTQ